MDWLKNNKYVHFIVIVVVVLVVLWLACIVLGKIGAHFNIGAGVGNSGATINIGGAGSK